MKLIVGSCELYKSKLFKLQRLNAGKFVDVHHKVSHSFKPDTWKQVKEICLLTLRVSSLPGDNLRATS